SASLSLASTGMVIVWVPAATSTVSSTATGAPSTKVPPGLVATAAVAWPPAAESTVTVAGGTAPPTVYVSDRPAGSPDTALVRASDPLLPGRPTANSRGGTSLSLEVAVMVRVCWAGL